MTLDDGHLEPHAGPSPFERWPRPLAFALSGGGAFGSVHIGMLRALTDAGVVPDMVVGTSVGALHGAMFAADPARCTDRLAEVWRTMDRRAAFGHRRDVLTSIVRHRSLSDGRRLRSLIDRHLPIERFDELAIPFAAVATDALTGEPELLTSGELAPALLASAAVPGLLPPVTIDGQIYVDGGVSANVPIRQALAFGAQSVISLDATPPVVASVVPNGFLARCVHSAGLMLRNQRSHAVDELASRYPIAVLPSPTPPDMGSFNFGHTERLVADSHDLTARTLANWAAQPVA